MNIGQLEYLVETVKKGSYHEASKTLFITPEALSKSIGSLEKELSVNLLVRSGRGVAPTDFARKFAKRAEEALETINDLKVFAQSSSLDATCTGSITLGVSTAHHRGEFISTDDFDRFKKMYPKIKLELLYSSSEMCASALRAGIVDAAVVLGRYDESGYVNHGLFSYAPCVAASKSNELIGRGPVLLEELRDLRLAMPTDIRCEYVEIRSHFAQQGISPHFESIAPCIGAHQKFLEEGGAIFVAKNAQLASLSPNVRLVPIHPQDQIKLPLYLAHLEKEESSPISILCEYLHNFAKSMRRNFL